MPTKVFVSQGGTQLTSIPAGSILAAQSTNVLSAITSTSGVKYLKNDNGVISWDTVNFDTSNLVPYTGAIQDVDLGNHNITANNLSGTNTGDETTLSIKTKLGSASSITDGYLTSTDWNTFNNKQNALGYTPENVANKGVANGYAPLNSSTKIDDSYLSQPIATTASPTFVGLKLNPSSQPSGANGLIYYDSTANKFEFYQNGSWVTYGSGNVTGPTSSTNNDIVLFSGASGTSIKDSGKTLPSGNIVGTSDTQTLQNKTLDNTNVITVKDSNLTIQNSTTTTKQAKFDASGISASTTRTYTLPNANTTLVGIDVAQTIQNKTLDNTNAVTVKDSNLTIQNSSDTTKQAKFDTSGITASTTRTYTLPDANTTLVGIDVAQTLTNKRINPRVYSTTSTSSLTPDTDSYDSIDITALAANLTINNPSGTPVNFQQIIIRIKDNGTARTISWGTAYASAGATLPTTTVAGKWVYIGLIYNASASQWQCVAVAQQS